VPDTTTVLGAVRDILTEHGHHDAVRCLWSHARTLERAEAAQLAAEQAARAAAERERDEYREGFHAAHEMYGAAVAIFKEQRRVLGVPEGDGVSIIDHCADLVRRLGVARKALKNAEVMLRGARVLLAASGATMGVYDATLAETKEALAALGPAPTPKD
jgi:hypothetical protein